MKNNLDNIANSNFKNIYEIDEDIKFDLIIGIHVFDHILI